MITYSSPAKIILSGEHSVVYGKPAFVSAVHLRLQVFIQESELMKVDPEIADPISYIEDNVITFLSKESKIDKKPFQFEIKSEIPRGRGMGSSAAFCVATVAALLEFYGGHEYDKQTINTLAYQSEKFFHGMPSGVDVSASCFGGLIFYRKEFEFLKHISSLNFKIPKNIQDTLLLIDSGKPNEATSEMVKHVGKRYNEDPKEMERILIEIEKCTKRMVVSVVKEDLNMFSDTVSTNQKLLEELGIVSESTKLLLEELNQFGVGKVTGAGGISEGSGVILFSTNKKEELQRYLESKQIWHTSFQLDFEGVKRG